MRVLATIMVASALGPSTARAAESAVSALERQFRAVVQPFLKTHCVSCHGDEEPEGDLSLIAFKSIEDVTHGHRRWEVVLERLESKEMPPEEAERHPAPEERAAVVEWIRTLRTMMAELNAGDPGPVLARRLSNAEYYYTVHDLTGVDIQPAREFPIDPANEAGFDNSGESLAMSPALLKKYLAAARHVADHLVLAPSGLRFAPHPVVADTDRDKYCVLRIVDFYRRQPTDLAEYFEAAWRFKHRAALGMKDATLADIAKDQRVSPKYLATVWAALEETPMDVGPLAKTQAKWRDLPAPDTDGADEVLKRCEELRDWVMDLRAKLEAEFDNLQHEEVAEGSQPFILWRNTQYATHRMSYDAHALQVDGGPSKRHLAAAEARRREAEEDDDDEDDRDEDDADESEARDPDLVVPADAAGRARHEESFARFAQAFPDAFYVAERGRAHMSREKQKQDKGRFLTAGFHNSHGYFRDDQPLYELILDENGQHELDELWRELDFVASAPIRQHADFIFYERAESRTIKGPEFDFVRSEDKDAASEAKIKRMAEVYLDMARKSLAEDGGDAESIPAIETFFENVNQNIRCVEQARLAAEPVHLKALLAFTERAYRRPLSEDEGADLRQYYHTLRVKDGVDHEDAIRECVVSVLMSPHFSFRINTHFESDGPQPLTDYALASRLSYFLWSSMPDEELLSHAAAGDLHRPEVLVAQVRRMLKDNRAGRLAVEFAGNWLDIRRFEEHNAVDRERFPSFDNELREAMFQEPMQFFTDIAANDRSVLDFLYGKHTFVNAPLAKHYGMDEIDVDADEWVRVEDADRYGRGGLLPMAAFLTKNAPGLRTSPVKRGYWVVRRVLGEVIPPPPSVVPELPHDEAQMGELSLRQILEKHRSDPSCASCHARFDSFGLAFEGYGPVGERREMDLGGRPIDARAEFPGGSAGVGLAGLQEYIHEQREQDFVDNLCRQMLAYALGRTLILTDEPALEAMRARLEADEYRFGSLIESIVTSPQFLTKRGRDEFAHQ